MKSKSNKRFFARPWGILCLVILLVAVTLLSLRFGSSFLKTKEFYGGLFGLDGYETQTVILFRVRLPRVLGGLLAGVGLSVSGVLLQNITGNDMASPNVIGVNSGAGFAVMLFLLLAPGAIYAMPFVAFIGAFLATLLIVAVSDRIGSGKATVILSGIALTAMLSAGISFISLMDTDLPAIYNYFAIGGLSGVTFEALPVPAVLIAVSVAVMLMMSRRVDAMTLGDGLASSLGVRVRRVRIVTLIAASASAAAVVSYAGLLGFVGLIVPHVARKLCGGGVKINLIVSALTGSILVLLADLVGRVAFAPGEIPVGIIMALIGAPFFFILLLRRKKSC